MGESQGLICLEAKFFFIGEYAKPDKLNAFKLQ